MILQTRNIWKIGHETNCNESSYCIYDPWFSVSETLRRLMGATEGAKRIKRVGIYAMAIGSLLGVGTWCFGLIAGTTKVGIVQSLIVLLALPLFFGGVIWVLGWIIEGFTQPPTR
jgi:hypothetical protein